MKCRQANGLMDKYMDGRLHGQIAEALTEHMDACRRCSVEFRARKELMQDLQDKRELRAQENFTQNVMAEIHQLQKKRAREKTYEARLAYFTAVRRLGISMILTAMVLLAYNVAPPALTGQFSSFTRQQGEIFNERTDEITGTFSNVNSRVRNVIKKFNIPGSFHNRY